MARALSPPSSRPGRPRWLVFAWGNDSRGDDALGPLLASSLAEEGWGAHGSVEILIEMQLQVEHVLDLADRDGVLFVDASTEGGEARILPVRAAGAADLFSHALRPEALLQAYQQVLSAQPPPAWQLALPAAGMALGAGLSHGGQVALQRGVALARDWLAARCGPGSQGRPTHPGHVVETRPTRSRPSR
jgi:hydrogenase maturation protease